MDQIKRNVILAFAAFFAFLLLYEAFSKFLGPLFAILLPIISITAVILSLKKLNKIKIEMEEKEDQYTKLEKEISDKLVYKAQLESEISKLNEEIQYKLKTVEDEPLRYLQAQKEQLNEEVERIKNNFEIKRNEFLALSEKMSDIENEIHQKKEELNLLQTNDPDYITEIKESNKSNMEQELDSLRSQIEFNYKLLNDLTKETDRIKKLKELYKEGILTEEEFESKKATILS